MSDVLFDPEKPAHLRDLVVAFSLEKGAPLRGAERNGFLRRLAGADMRLNAQKDLAFVFGASSRSVRIASR